ncbi:tRNA synthetases class II-domain-containing protein [Mycena maculata]|uniref:tRNA synthetases class II-domain-containing protein n=1 Tax=Mycena maculata TaxID=230809 RepID=A0AAD7K099_9AGAR|nr:tRNA synthetases class II-domain-containing protein [Mycena maculata]
MCQRLKFLFASVHLACGASWPVLAFLDPPASILLPLCGLIVVSLLRWQLPPRVQSPSAPFPKRTHNCGALTAADVGSRVVLTGWLLPERKGGKELSFFPLKDSLGTTQLVVNHPEVPSLSEVPVESAVLIEGTVLGRPPAAKRPGPTGDIDVHVDNFILLNPADANLPFLPSNSRNLANEDLRARFRYLDLRRSALSANLRMRSRVAQIVRNILHEQGMTHTSPCIFYTKPNTDFTEVETPVLLRSSPEGAREFLVPTRIATDWEEPRFFTLPQSPQQPKQLLICSGGVDKYFQIAKCFRDEDGRKDRQPEFTQIDLEMAFVSWGARNTSDSWRIGGTEVRDVIETLVRKIWKDVEGTELPQKFKVMTYQTAMKLYGSDKPDTRFDLKIVDTTCSLAEERRLAFESRGEVLECLPVRQSRESKFIDASRQCEFDAPVERIILTENNLSVWLTQSSAAGGATSEGEEDRINENLHLKLGDVVWLCRSPKVPRGGSSPLGQLRLHLSELAQSSGKLTLSTKPHFLWITEFPLFTRSDGDKEFLARGRWSSTHHPFTAPMWQDIEALYSGDIEGVRGQHYDLVLNGVEIGGGSVRVHDAAMQDYIFTNILQLSEQEKAPFSQLLHALRCGAPPHGGIALGFDRLMAILCNAQSIRDVIAFPKTSVGTDLLFKSPAVVNEIVLEQYGIQPRHEGGKSGKSTRST